MLITTDDESLLELYSSGKTSDKKYKSLPTSAIKGYIKAVKRMKAADRIEDLFKYAGLHYEALHGDREGQESVRCDIKWRLIFHSFPEEGSIIINSIELLEISKHYEH